MIAHETTHILEDNAPYHEAQYTKDFMNEMGLVVLKPWGGNSPDLNPIENLFGIVKRRCWERDMTTRNNVIMNADEIWSQVTPAMCDTLACSMPRRIRQVLAANGQSIGY